MSVPHKLYVDGVFVSDVEIQEVWAIEQIKSNLTQSKSSRIKLVNEFESTPVETNLAGKSIHYGIVDYVKNKMGWYDAKPVFKKEKVSDLDFFLAINPAFEK